MITRIELTNFMSHASTVIEPAPGLTVLVGPNNCGKSAVVAALQILCHNDKSTYVMRHGEKECSVAVHTDDGHVIQWRRKSSPSYLIDGKVYDRLQQSGLPEQLHEVLRLAKVEAGNDSDFDVHFGTQKDPIFLLRNSASNAAKFFASSSDAIRLVEMQKRHKEKHQAAKSEKARLEEESRQLTLELEKLAPAIELDERVKQAESLHREILSLEGRIEQAQAAAERWQSQQSVITGFSSQCQALADLAAPPEQHDVAALSRLCDSLLSYERQRQNENARHQSLMELAVPPLQHDVDSLSQLVVRLEQAARQLQACTVRSEVIENLADPPKLDDAEHLASLLSKLESASSSVQLSQRLLESLGELPSLEPPQDTAAIAALLERWERQVKFIDDLKREANEAEIELAAATESLRTFAAQSTCPTCGGPLDPDRVIARAIVPGGACHG